MLRPCAIHTRTHDYSHQCPSIKRCANVTATLAQTRDSCTHKRCTRGTIAADKHTKRACIHLARCVRASSFCTAFRALRAPRHANRPARPLLRRFGAPPTAPRASTQRHPSRGRSPACLQPSVAASRGLSCLQSRRDARARGHARARSPCTAPARTKAAKAVRGAGAMVEHG